ATRGALLGFLLGVVSLLDRTRSRASRLLRRSHCRPGHQAWRRHLTEELGTDGAVVGGDVDRRTSTCLSLLVWSGIATPARSVVPVTSIADTRASGHMPLSRARTKLPSCSMIFLSR